MRIRISRKAIDCFTKAIVSEKQYLNYLCNILREIKTQCNGMCLQNVKSTEAQYYKLRGNCYNELGRYADAILDFHQVAEIEPTKENIISLNEAIRTNGIINQDIAGETNT